MGNGNALGIDCGQHFLEKRKEAQVRLKETAVVAHDLQLNIVAHDRTQFGQHVGGREAGQEPAVQFQLDLAEDDVGLEAAMDYRCVDRVVEQRVQRLGLAQPGRGHAVEHPVGLSRIEQRSQRTGQLGRRGRGQLARASVS